jgi:hypothetical protein
MRGMLPIEMKILLLVNCRDHHSITRKTIWIYILIEFFMAYAFNLEIREELFIYFVKEHSLILIIAGKLTFISISKLIGD